jgi:hypothetical protein
VRSGCPPPSCALADRGGAQILLGQAGFIIDAVYGGWERQPVGADDRELLVLARVDHDTSRRK